MKLFLKILAGIVIFFVVLLIGLNLYFTDDRLKNMILPEVREAVKTDVQVERMSLTFFRTFPRFGVELQQFLLPDPEGNTVASIEELLVSVELFPLFRNELSISRLDLLQPAITYRVFEDGTTNIDFLTGLAEEDDEPADDGLAIRIPRFSVTSGSLLYSDAQTDTELSLNGLDAQLSLLFSELIETSIDAQLESLSYSADGKPVVQNLSLGLRQTSVLNLDEETLTLTEGVLSIRGLALNLSGSLADWSSDAPSVDLQFTSSSDNFGELLRLAPSEFDEQLAGLDASGALTLDGFVNGRLGSEEIPEFSLVLQVTDGYLQNPDLPQPIEEIVIDLEINNQTAQLRTFRARAAQNRLSASGSLDRPLDEDGAFSLQAEGDVDLATVASFYPIGEMGVEQLSGKLELDLTANGRRDIPEEASFDGRFILDGGMLKYADVPRAIEDIQARVQANQNRITVESAGFRASNNEFTLSGSVDHPLDEAQRRLDLQAGLQFDLATIKEFYPIDEDTLTLRGQLTADLTLNGQLDPERPELLLSRSSMELSNGYIAHRLLGRALEEVTFRAEANREVLTLQTARFVSGPNSVAVRGSVTDYLTDVPIFDVTVEGDAEFGDIATYYSLEPWLNELSGSATMNLNAKGPAGDPTALALNGRLSVVNVAASGDSLPFPVSNANGVLRLTPDSMNLEEFTMNYGSSDFSLEGRVQNYLGFLAEEHNSEATMPAISGTYHSRFLNMDELIDWEEERDPTEPIPIGLPRLTSTVTASIDSMVVLGVPITNIVGAGRTTPTVIILDNARGTMFEGIMEGKMEWQVPDPNRTTLSFTGTLDSLTAKSFFRDTGFLGNESTFHEHVSGDFNADITYQSELDETLAPDLTTTLASGTFGMSRARLQNHPLQIRIAEFLRTESLRNMALDEWDAEFSIADTVVTFKNFRLTSDGIGLNLEGTQHLVTERINYHATLLLPERFKSTISSIISSRAADALQNEDGMLAIPILITGTSSNPQVGPDTGAINRIIEERLRDGAGDVLRRLFGGN